MNKTTILINEQTLNLNNNFKKWFGNSKVIDDSGNPMIVFHGTSKGAFEIFKPKKGYKGKSKQQADLGSHFSIDKEYAQGYAGDKKNSKLYECYLRIENPLLTNVMIWREDDEQTFQTYLNFILDAYKKHYKLRGENYYDKQFTDKLKEPQNLMLNSFILDNIPSAKLYDKMIEYGFDGMFHEPYNRESIYHFKNHPRAYIILKANQVKAVDNDGTWDLDDDNIYS